jgi:predicted transcriptional regulator of viral defense system
MRAIEAYRRLRAADADVLDTADAAALLGVKSSHASRTLERLADAGQIIRLKRGLWGFVDRLDPLQLPGFLAAPMPCYVSLQTALYHHGMISQIPETIYAVSLARTRRWSTRLATVSIHHVCPSFFFGYERAGTNGILMASPEKALLDCLYLSPARSRLFVSLPELELPPRFNRQQARAFAERIPSQRLRVLVLRRLDAVLGEVKRM